MNKYVEATLNNKKCWKESNYFNFLQKCNKEEFLQSQIPFYYAVEAFPRMLLLFASTIENSYDRLNIIENIWEEHGEGDSSKFHTNTFKQHLINLGFKDNGKMFQNPYIKDWINNILTINKTSSEWCATLAAIEFMYAVISEDISEYIESLNLNSESVHYKKHSHLDWSHGQELIDVLENHDTEIDMKIFDSVQKEFIFIFNRMVLPTEKELLEVSKNPVSFFYSREDSTVETNVIQRIQSKKIDIFTICSGGEHILEYLTFNRNMNIDVVDVNEEQINIFWSKLKGENLNPDGKFEYFFAFLREMLTDFNDDPVHELSEYLTYFTHLIFSRKNLNIVFTENATKYSSKCFATHFNCAFEHSINEGSRNAQNIFLNIPLKSKATLDDLNNKIVNTFTSNLIDFKFESKYDLIDLSNIGDWMDIENYQKIINKSFDALKKDGKLIVRKLLGDYDLDIILKDFSKIEDVKDYTYFYSQTLVCSK